MIHRFKLCSNPSPTVCDVFCWYLEKKPETKWNLEFENVRSYFDFVYKILSVMILSVTIIADKVSKSWPKFNTPPHRGQRYKYPFSENHTDLTSAIPVPALSLVMQYANNPL